MAPVIVALACNVELTDVEVVEGLLEAVAVVGLLEAVVVVGLLEAVAVVGLLDPGIGLEAGAT